MSLTDADSLHHRAQPWWSNPVVGLCIFALPGVALAMTASNGTFVELWGEAKHVNTVHVLVAGGAILAFAAGAAWVQVVLGSRRPTRATVTTARLSSAYQALVVVALVGYAAWGVIGLSRGVRVADLAAVLEGQPLASYNLKQLMAPVAGVTTLTQVAPIVGGLAGILVARGETSLARRSMVVLLVLAALRAYFLSERLAILELVLPAMVSFFLSPRRRRERRSTAVLRTWFPAIYVLGATVIFLAFEFNRSWAYYRLTTSGTYLDFAVSRFAGYYSTSINNGALLYEGSLGARPPLFTLQWLVDFPVIGDLLGLGENRLPLNELLVGSANPEFNTEGALLSPAIDFGLLPSILVWFVLGTAAMGVYRRVRAGEVWWLPLYACLYVGILESGRYFYWGLGRALVPIVAGVVVARFLARGRTQPVETSTDHVPAGDS